MKRKLIFGIIVIGIKCLAAATHYPFCVDAKIGFIDSTGVVVVEPSIKGTLNGYMYAKDADLIPFYVTHFPLNVAEGFIDQNGKVVIEPAFNCIGIFSEGLASLQKNSDVRNVGFIDKTGRIVIQEQFSTAQDFHNARAFVCFGKNYGYIDRNGKPVFLTTYTYDNRFSEGLAPVFSPNRLLAYADTNGNIVLKTPFEYGSHFNERRALVIRDNKIGFIDRSGKLVIPCQFSAYNGLQISSYSVFHEGRCFVNLNGRFVMIDTLGNVLSKSIEIDQAYSPCRFSEGLAPVSIKGKTYYIDRNGDISIKTPFSHGYNFSDGIANVGISKEIDGYINKAGKVIFQYKAQ